MASKGFVADKFPKRFALWLVCHVAVTGLLFAALEAVVEAHRLDASVPHSHGEVELTGFGLLFLSLAAIEAVRAVWVRRAGRGPPIPDHADL